MTTPNLLQEAVKKARYGHRDWLHWTDRQGQEYIALRNAESIKQALLASGTQGRFLMIAANCGWLMEVRWSLGMLMLRNARYNV